MENIETEVKFYIKDEAGLKENLISLGAVSSGVFFETNIRYDDKMKSLLKSSSLLRLRKDAKTTLTFKSRIPGADNRFKMMKEIEVEVGDFSSAEKLLESIGFIKEQIYEKRREMFRKGKICFCIDKMPFGFFLEIEGQPDDIVKYSSLLGLDWEKRILLNYLEIFDGLKKTFKLSFSDVTFDNFKHLKIDLSDYIENIKAV
jgi:adenylate cyclase class 2